MGCGILKKMVQRKDTLNEKQSFPCWSWCHGPLLFIHQFLRFVLLLILHYSRKIVIPNYHLLLLLQVLHPVLFKSLQLQGELGISGDRRVVLWRARDGNRRHNSWGYMIYHLFGTDMLQSILNRQFQKVVLLVLQQCSKDWVVIGGRSTTFDISSCVVDLVDGAQCKCKRKSWFVFYTFLWTFWEIDCFRISCEIFGWLNISKS